MLLHSISQTSVWPYFGSILTSLIKYLDKKEATTQFEKLIKALTGVGLATEVRTGEDHTLLVFVRVDSHEHLYAEVYRSR
jgi:hypothetical protein